jgi:erythromycin esterase-like protein
VQPPTVDLHQSDRLLEGVGNARIVLLGKATHGTREFYRERAFLTGVHPSC